MTDATPSCQQMLGLPSEVRANGKTYKFGPAIENTAGHLEGLFAVQAVREVKKLQEFYTAEEYETELQAVRASIAGKQYATGEAGWQRSFQSTAGQELFFLTLFRVNHPNMTVEEFREIASVSVEEFLAAVEVQVPGFFIVAFPKADKKAIREQAAKYLLGVRKALQKLSVVSSPNSTEP